MEEHQNDIYLPLGRDGIESILIHKYLGFFLFWKLPENPERTESSKFKTMLANPGRAAPLQLPDMVIPRKSLFLAACGAQPFQPAFEHVLAT